MVFFRLIIIFNCVGFCLVLFNVIIRVLRKFISFIFMEVCLNKRFYEGVVVCVLNFFGYFFVIFCNVIIIIKKI